MYPSIRTPPALTSPGAAAPERKTPDGKTPPERKGWFRVGPNVFFLGLTSLVTDISAEMVAAILPLYLIFQLGLTPLQFGVFNGAYQAALGPDRARDRVRGGSPAPLQGDRRLRLRALRRVQAGPARGRHRALSCVTGAARRPGGEGDPDVTTRRVDLVVGRARPARDRLRCAPRDGHRRRADRPARGVPDPRRCAQGLRRGVRRELPDRARRARHPAPLRAQPPARAQHGGATRPSLVALGPGVARAAEGPRGRDRGWAAGSRHLR